MLVRRAKPQDWEAVARLLAELGRPATLGENDEKAHGEAFLHYLRRNDTMAFVVEQEGEIVGFCDLEFRQRLAFLSPQAWIPDLIVTEKARSLGAGAALIARAEAESRARGCWGLELESANWRERAHAFYEREGLKATGKSFNKLLADIEWPPAPR